MAAFAPTVLRLTAGVVFAAHGAQKLFGLGGGGGLTATAAFFAQVGLAPAFVLAMAVGLAELAGGVLLLAGLFTRLAAGVLAVDMLVAVWKVHFANGFFLNWTNTAGAGHGYEFNLVLIGVLVALILTGPGAFSIDRSSAREAGTEAAGRARLRTGAV
jgi:putative oxidoreductase